MNYCFIKQELDVIPKEDPLSKQAEYAKELDKFFLLDLEQECLYDKKCRTIMPQNSVFMLRCTCDNLQRSLFLSQKLKIKLVESFSDIKKIESWNKLIITNRKIFSICFRDIIEKNYTDEFISFLNDISIVFVKSQEKGVTIKCTTNAFLRSKQLFDCLQKFSENDKSIFLVTEYLDVKSDSIGKKETRHIVFGGNVLNSSRCIHSLMHNSLSSHNKAANSFVKMIELLDFPKNYVLDIGEFIQNGKRIIDIVEINPLSTSMCYINNSVFFESKDKNICEIHNKTNMGWEYCFDYIKHEIDYRRDFYVGERFEYIHDNYFEFI